MGYPSFRRVGLGPCEGNVFEAFLGGPSVLQEGGARALRRESFGAATLGPRGMSRGVPVRP